MKVRCIAAGAYSDELTTGKEYEVLAEIGCYYQLKINDKGQGYQCYIKSRFEIVREDNKMQEKTFREVIADIKEREVWICEKFNRKIIKSDDGVIEIRKLNDETFDNVSALIFNDEKYKLQRKEYTFKEAFKAYEEGKEIESCKTGYRYKKINGEDGFYSKFSGEWIEDDITFNCEEIRSSWYINY